MSGKTARELIRAWRRDLLRTVGKIRNVQKLCEHPSQTNGKCDWCHKELIPGSRAGN